MIIDEIQTGLGRTGKLWGIEHFDVTPDIMVIGKGLSGGVYPVTATCFKKELESVFYKDPFVHISTFGGAEAGCPVALKVLDMCSQPDFLAHVNRPAALLSQGFEELQHKPPALLARLRQLGLPMGIAFTDARLGPVFTKAAYEAGLFSVYAANDTRVSQFLPPLTIDESLANEILARTDAALNGMEKMMQI